MQNIESNITHAHIQDTKESYHAIHHDRAGIFLRERRKNFQRRNLETPWSTKVNHSTNTRTGRMRCLQNRFKESSELSRINRRWYKTGLTQLVRTSLTSFEYVCLALFAHNNPQDLSSEFKFIVSVTIVEKKGG